MISAQSTYTVTGSTVVLPPTAAQIAWEKVSNINAPTRKGKLKIALTTDTTDYDKIKIKPLTDRLAAIELYEEGRARQEQHGKKYAPVIYQEALEKRKKKLYKSYGGSDD